MSNVAMVMMVMLALAGAVVAMPAAVASPLLCIGTCYPNCKSDGIVVGQCGTQEPEPPQNGP